MASALTLREAKGTDPGTPGMHVPPTRRVLKHMCKMLCMSKSTGLTCLSRALLLPSSMYNLKLSFFCHRRFEWCVS